MRPSTPRLGRLAAGLLMGLSIIGLGLPALADPADPDPAVEEARRQERIAAASVQQIEEMLDQLQDKTAAAEQAAGVAAEAFNQAAVDLDLATEAADQARQAADQASQSLAKARGQLARAAIATSQNQSGLYPLKPLLNENGMEEALQEGTVLSLVGSAAERASARYAVAEQAAKAATILAGQTENLRQEKAAAQLVKAEAAQAAADEALAAQAAAEVEHTQLLAVLAEKKNTTVAAEQAAEQRRIDEANRRAEEERRRQQEEALRPPPPRPPSPGQPEPPTSGKGDPPPDNDQLPPPVDGGISSDEAAAAAVGWARAQIGKPYQWGATGPDSFDCSGLAQAAWLNGGGKAIPRVAAAQYAAATKVAYSDMRPGDLIFWGSNVYHVALYSGGGMMIEAPSTGQTVKEIPVRWAGTTEWAGRF